MSEMKNIRYVWNNGAESPYLEQPTAQDIEEIDVFKRKSGATRVVAVRWTHGNQIHDAPSTLRVLRDRTGYVYCDGRDASGKALIVVNGDDTPRLRIGVPRVSEKSRPSEGYLGLPPSSASFGGIEWGSEGNDGDTDYLFEFDWNSGALTRFSRPPRPW